MDQEPLSQARLRHFLDVQSRQIARVLNHHRVPASVVGGSVQSRTVSYDLQTHLTAGLERVRGLKDDLKSALGVGDVAVVREEGQWRLRVGRPEDAAVPLLRLLASLPDLPPITAAAGLADGGQPVLLRFGASRIRHLLVAGDPGAGKTSLLRAIAAGLALTNRQSTLQLLLLDPRGLESDSATGAIHPLRPLGYLPHMLTDPMGTLEDCTAALHFLAEEMEYRRRVRTQTPRVVALIDHVVTLADEGGATARMDLMRLIQHGAGVGIHLVMATDRPDAPLMLERTMRSCVPTRIVGRVGDEAAARKVAGRPLEQATLLYGEGDFLAVMGDDVTYFQAAYVGDYDLHMKLSELARSGRPRLLAQPYSPRPRLEDENPQLASDKQSFQWRDGMVDLESDEVDDSASEG